MPQRSESKHRFCCEIKRRIRERVVRSHKGPQRENVLFEAIEASRVAFKNLIQVKVFLKIKKLPFFGVEKGCECNCCWQTTLY